MLRPEPMTRVLVVGPKDQLERVIETLYDLRLLHLVDYRGQDEVFGLGRPLPKASEASEHLVKLRSIASILRVEEAEKPEAVDSLADLRQRIVTLEVNLREEDEARKKIEGLLHDLNRQIDGLRPFAGLGLPLEAYRGYESIEVLVGRVAGELSGMETVMPEHETFTADGIVALFVPKDRAEAAREFLARFVFSPLDVPKGEGDSKALLARAESDQAKWTARLNEVEARIAKLRDKSARFIVEAQDALQEEVEKAEAPLRFAASEHSFVVDGWVPTARVATMTKPLAALSGLHVETLPESHSHEESEPPPVLLKNPKPVRRFEFLTNLYSTPQHDEVDPTAFLFLLFPVFFGLMIGDAGYGLVMIVLGLALSVKLRGSPDFADLMRVILYGGIFAFAFGLLVFGEIFGIPFHAPAENPQELSWSAVLGYAIPYSPLIHKLETVGVIDLLLLSVVASSIHLGLGYVVGFVNEVRHNKRHALGRIGWLFILVGFLSFFAVLARTPAGVPLSSRVVNQIFLDRPPLVWIPAVGLHIGGMTIPFFMLGTIFAGIGILLAAEPMAVLETISLLANMVSYTRLAGVAVAKGAAALAFNTMLLPLIINERLFHDQGIVQINPNVLFLVVGFVLLFLAHAMVLILGAISAGIQAIRLNYVEFFLKFYKGGGQLFSPFGTRKPKTEA